MWPFAQVVADNFRVGALGVIFPGVSGPNLVVLFAPACNNHLGFHPEAKPLHREALVPNFPVKLSTIPFCQGLPGSIKAMLNDSFVAQRTSAFDTNYGPLSERRASVPRGRCSASFPWLHCAKPGTCSGSPRRPSSAQRLWMHSICRFIIAAPQVGLALRTAHRPPSYAAKGDWS